MTCDKCSSGGKGLCPMTLGLSLGLTCALGVLFFSAWSIWFGLPTTMASHMTMPLADNWADAGMNAVWALVRGFLGGFVFAMIYSMICCCKSKCCGKCSCCSTNGKK